MRVTPRDACLCRCGVAWRFVRVGRRAWDVGKKIEIQHLECVRLVETFVLLILCHGVSGFRSRRFGFAILTASGIVDGT